MNTSTPPQVPQSDVSAHLAAIVSQAVRCALFSSSRKATNKHVKIMLAARAAMIEIRADLLFPESQPDETSDAGGTRAGRSLHRESG